MAILYSFKENKLEYEDEDEVKIKMIGTGMDKESLEHNLYKNDITSRARNSFVYDSNPNYFNDPSNFFNHPPQPQYETYSCELCENDSHYGFDCPPQFSLVYEWMPNIFVEKLLQQKQAASIDQSPLQEMSIQDMEDLKQHYLDEMLSLSNDLQIKDYRNEKIDIHFSHGRMWKDALLS
ncbi:hypothetical protein Tco_0336013 [Tanacetum coccineum]